MMNERILIIEDDERISDLLKLYLEKEGFKVDVAKDGNLGISKFAKENPDLLILDLMLPEIDGLTVTRSIRAKSNMPIIMLTAKDEETDKIVGLEIGADDYVTKPFSPKELVARVKAVLRRTYETKKSKPIIKIRDLEINQDKFEVKKNGKNIELTRREFKLLLALSQNPGKVFSRSELMRSIYSHDDEVVLDRTIDVHVANLRRKLNNRDQNLIIAIKGVGYKLKE